MQASLKPLDTSKARVLVVGDVMLDRYWFGDVSRISPEAPVPVVLIKSEDERLGGAANVAWNCKDLGAQIRLLSVVGKDEPGAKLAKLLKSKGIEASLHRDAKLDTTLKLRIIGRRQQLLRIDFERPPSREVLASKLEEFKQALPESDVVILSDYGKGGLAHIAEMIRSARRAGKRVLVDPKGDDYARYKGASLITPNVAELREVVGRWQDEKDLKGRAQALLGKLGLEALLLTRGEDGMTLFQKTKTTSIGAEAREVFDVTGAGDTVIAALAVTLAAGAGLDSAMRLANRAAGIVVGKLGTATVTPAELFGERLKMYYVVTGAAGFIGSKLVEGLNRRGITDIIAVDDLAPGRSRAANDKFRNLVHCEIADYMDQAELLESLDDLSGAVEAVFHQGACSDTTETDGRYVMGANYRYSKRMLEWCQDEEIPLLYASSAAVYGDSQEFREERRCEKPLNLYAYSKFVFDQFVRRMINGRTAQIAGLRYFNVYGPNEQHKVYGTDMRSVAYQAFQQLKAEGRVKLFVGSDGYGNGEQRRDFVYVDDVVAVNMWLLERPDVSGIFNCGTGRAQTFNDVATAVINAARGTQSSTQELVGQGLITYVPFPEKLVGKYQSYTQADLSRLRGVGLSGEFMTVEQGVAAYVAELSKAK